MQSPEMLEIFMLMLKKLGGSVRIKTEELQTKPDIHAYDLVFDPQPNGDLVLSIKKRKAQ